MNSSPGKGHLPLLRAKAPEVTTWAETLNLENHFSFKFYLQQHRQALFNCLQHWRQKLLSTITTIVMIGLILTLPMIFLAISHHAEEMMQNLSKTSQVTIYLKMGTTEQKITSLLTQLRQRQDIVAVNYISPQQGLQELAQVTQLNSIINNLPANPLPAVIAITPKLSSDQAINAALLSDLHNFAEVESLDSNQQWLSRLNLGVQLITKISVLIALFFSLVVFFVVVNTLRLSFQRQHEQIYLLRLLGATKSFIRRSFLYQGICYGLTGGILAYLITLTLMAWLGRSLRTLMDALHIPITLQNFGVSDFIVLLVMSLVVSWIAAWLATTQYLSWYESNT